MVLAPPIRPQWNMGHAFHNFYSSSPIDAICHLKLKLVQWFQIRSQKCSKVYHRLTTYDERQRKKTDSKICHLSDSGDLKKRIVQVVLFKKLDEAYILRYNVNVTIHIIGIKSRASIAMREKRCLKNIKGCTKFLVNPLQSNFIFTTSISFHILF